MRSADNPCSRGSAASMFRRQRALPFPGSLPEAFLGPLRDASGTPIEIDGVWALQFRQDGGPNGAHNQLFFTAGPNNYADGLFGVITFAY
jgi:hypothetical protein